MCWKGLKSLIPGATVLARDTLMLARGVEGRHTQSHRGKKWGTVAPVRGEHHPTHLAEPKPDPTHGMGPLNQQQSE